MSTKLEGEKEWKAEINAESARRDTTAILSLELYTARKTVVQSFEITLDNIPPPPFLQLLRPLYSTPAIQRQQYHHKKQMFYMYIIKFETAVVTRRGGEKDTDVEKN